MKIALYGNNEAGHRKEDLDALLATLDAKGFSWQVNREFAAKITAITGREIPSTSTFTSAADMDAGTELMVCYGGDGTFLAGVKLLDTKPVPMAGINSGRLGFLTNITKEEMDGAFDLLKAGQYRIVERPLLEVSGDLSTAGGDAAGFPYAFNEFSVQRYGASMISTEVYVDSEMIATYWGDGVLISTPAGSTAYSLSVGGPVVAPECNCFVISPIAPHNLSMRPVVIPDDSTVMLRTNARDGRFRVSLDNRIRPAADGMRFSVKKAKKTVFLVQFQNISFYDTLRNKMMWGIDRRDRSK